MKKIYLASRSKARKKLLELFGFKCRVILAAAREIRSKERLSYAQLVKKNALAKAKSAAKKIKSGVIIAADTITVQDGRIFGKPANLRKAKQMLKKLSNRPQWLYTGVAVIDKKRNVVKLACEKTKVYMDKLNDKQIQDYFASVSPLDKAGGFDIQGRGAFFIRRIEGCFYNVVGLPLRRLYRMLKEIGAVSIMVSLALCGCSTEYNIATKQEESYYYSTDKEEKIGQSIARQVEKEYKFAEDPLVQKRVEDIGKKVAAICDRKDIDYRFMVIEDDEVNAFALPGGYIYVNRGLVDKVDNDDQLAGVLAHEIGHIVARHSIKKLQAINSYYLLRILVAATPQAAQLSGEADEAFVQIMLGYSREDELLADQLSARYAALAGYDPHGMINFLEKLQEMDRRKPLQPKSYYKTHPYIPDRLRVVRQELGEKISFDDYINTEQLTHESAGQQARP